MCHKNDETITGDTESLDLNMPIYNLIEYTWNYSETVGNLWFFQKMMQLMFMLILQTVIILNHLNKGIDY